MTAERAATIIDGLSISQAAEASGLSVDTLRYYERAGLTRSPPDRSASGQRRYSAADLSWLAMLVMLRKTGMPIRDIRSFVELYQSEGSELERLDVLEHHRERVLVELHEVQAHLEAIERKIQFYRGSANQT